MDALQVGSVEASEAERRRLAVASHAWNRKVSAQARRSIYLRQLQLTLSSAHLKYFCQTSLFCELFPELVVDSPAADISSDGVAQNQENSPDAPAGASPLLMLGGVALAAAGIACIMQQI